MQCLKLQSRRQDKTTGLICHSVDIVKHCLEHSSLPYGKTFRLPIAAAVQMWYHVPVLRIHLKELQAVAKF